MKNTQYKEILGLLANSTKTYKEIAEITGTTYSIVQCIFLGRTHIWLKKEFPEEYTEIEFLRKLGHRNPKKIKIYQEIKLAIDFNIPYNVPFEQDWLLNVFTLKELQNIQPIKPKPKFVLKAPDGTIHNVFNQKEFCTEHKLTRQGLYELRKGKVKKYKNWTLHLG